MPDVPRVVVVGGGVIGIGAALAILQRNPRCKLTVISDKFTPDTTGDGAAGLWCPFLPGETSLEKIVFWSSTTYDLLHTWRRTGTNIVLSAVAKFISKRHVDSPPWKNMLNDFRYLSKSELEVFGKDYKGGYQFTALIAEPFLFLPNLIKEIKQLGGQFKVQKLGSLSEVASIADIIVNCTGLGSYHLVPDRQLYPIRGQVIRVNAPWIQECIMDDEDENSPAYIIPNSSSVILGGTTLKNDWSTTVDPEITERILKGAAKLEPSLKGAEVIKEWVGLRPARRGGVRLEEDSLRYQSRNVPVIHNYGHGGSGVTLFWGCAADAAELTDKILQRKFGPNSRL